ncbi:IS21 family transposase [Bacteroidota bacterium]
MANVSIAMVDIRQILRLHNNNTSQSEISRMLGITRKTISRYLSIARACSISYPDIERISDEEISELFLKKELNDGKRLIKLHELLPSYEKRLSKKGVTKYFLWEEYKLNDPGGYNYTQFCHYFKEYLKKNEAVMHFEHKAGDKMFIDFTGHKLEITDRKTGEISKAEVFVAILGASGQTYVEAVPSQQKADFISATENALHYFGGVPRAIVPDNLKSGVTKSSNYEAEVNRDFKNFALHYGTTVLATRPGKPKDKPLVENAVKIIYTRIFAKLYDRRFYNLTDLNEAILELLDVHNRTKLQRRNYSRHDFFEEVEKSELSALPVSKYEIKEYKRLTVNKNCHIYLSCDKHYYSVPYKYISKKVQVIYTKSYVEVYLDYKRIAFHKRDYNLYKYSTIKEHLPSHHQFVSDWSPGFFINWAKGIGRYTENYIQCVLNGKAHPEQAYKSCIGILKYGKELGYQRLENACKRASHYNSYSYTSIKRILSKGLDKLEIENKDQYTLPMHENLRGGSYYN